MGAILRKVTVSMRDIELTRFFDGFLISNGSVFQKMAICIITRQLSSRSNFSGIVYIVIFLGWKHARNLFFPTEGLPWNKFRK